MTIEDVTNATKLIDRMHQLEKIIGDIERIMRYDTNDLAVEVHVGSCGGTRGSLLLRMEPCPMLPELLEKVRDEKLAAYVELERELDQM